LHTASRACAVALIVKEMSGYSAKVTQQRAVNPVERRP
jgi:hypothetical protein